MKKILAHSIAGVAALLSVAVPSYGQGKINLNNYSESGNQITYGSGFGGLTGHGLLNGQPSGVTWTIGFYYALGDVTSSVSAAPSTFADPSTLGGGLAVAYGAAGDITTINNGFGGGSGGYFSSISDGIINGWTAGAVTFEVVAYVGTDYTSSIYRGHSAAFLLTPADSTSAAPQISAFGSGMPAFSINVIPEPPTFALAGVGSALFLFLRRKRS
jgi:hypothetical protein